MNESLDMNTLSIPCRNCGAPLHTSVLDLGASPLANSFVHPTKKWEPESFFALQMFVCNQCHLAQAPDVADREEIFNSEYVYFSSASLSVVEHGARYAEAMTTRFGLDSTSQIIEIASNDGYLLKHFAARGVPVLGIEPSQNVANVALEAGIPTEVRFFGAECARDLAARGVSADLLHGANVLAHVPDINDFVAGVPIVLARGGVATFEFPHLLQMLERLYYDMIYHEHFSYLSLLAAEGIFARHGLAVFDVEEIEPQGGSLRVFVRRAEDVAIHPETPAVAAFRRREAEAGLHTPQPYAAFANAVARSKHHLLRFLIEAREEGKTVAGYGAPAKGNTLLNYCGVKTDLLPYTVDASPAKQGLLLPGTRIPVYAPQRIFETRPDYVLILPWNIKEEIMRSMAAVRDWGGRFVVPLPDVRTLD